MSYDPIWEAIVSIPPEVWLRPYAPANDLIKAPIKDSAKEPTAMLHDADYDHEAEEAPKKIRRNLRDSANGRDQAAIVKTIGERMRQARELCNLSQIEAARRFGYSNPSKLSKIEGATDTNSVPLWVVLKASAAYEVSTDYLFGLSEDFEISPRATQERIVSRWVLAQVDTQQRLVLDTLFAMNEQIARVIDVFPKTHAQALEVARALARFRELNPGFEDMRGGSTLLAASEHVVDGAASANEIFHRFRGHLRFMDGVAAVSPALNAPVMEAANV
jgi:transcriptional regulator with XRE-family HTH domain